MGGWYERLELVPLLESKIVLDKDVLDIGEGPFGRRQVFTVKSGTFEFVNDEFSGIRGDILPMSADWAMLGKGSSEDQQNLRIDVRALLEYKDPADVECYIYASYSNVVLLTEKNQRDLTEGRIIDFDESTFIVQPLLEVGRRDTKVRPASRDLTRLNHAPVIAHGKLGANTIEYHMYEVVNRRAPKP